MGAFTTFSTFKLEAVQLLNRKILALSFLYLSATYIIGILFAFLGMKLGGKSDSIESLSFIRNMSRHME